MARILIIEDSMIQSRIMSHILEGHGHEVICVTDGLEGITKAQDITPDLILLDVVMPEMDGFRTTRQLVKNSKTSNIPIIIVSAKDKESDRVWGLRQGASDYIGKPIQESVLIGKVNTLLHA